MSIWIVHFDTEPDVMYFRSAKRAYDYIKETLIDFISSCNECGDREQVLYYEKELEKLERDYSAINEDDSIFGANIMYARKEEVY